MPVKSRKSIATFEGWFAALLTFFAVRPAEVCWFSMYWSRAETPFNVYSYIAAVIVLLYIASRALCRPLKPNRADSVA
jgi:hypothetical protein